VRAYKGTISFDGVSGPGVIVDFQKSWRLLFWTKLWAGASQWDLGDDLWITNEWMEVNSIEDTRWFEPMMDVEARYSRIDILESGDARARVHSLEGAPIERLAPFQIGVVEVIPLDEERAIGSMHK
jgi:hypothetical protein